MLVCGYHLYNILVPLAGIEREIASLQMEVCNDEQSNSELNFSMIFIYVPGISGEEISCRDQENS